MFNKFAPVNNPRDTALKIAEFSWYFFSDYNLGHLQLIFNKIPKFHIDIYEILYGSDRTFVFSTPSEFGKTTIFTIYIIYSVLYKLEPFITISSRVAATSHSMLYNITDILYEHEDIKRFYGKFIPDKKSSIYLNNNTTVRFRNDIILDSIPVGGNIRSKKFVRYRPTLSIVDDPDNIQDIRSPITLFKHVNWIRRDLLPRTDKNFGRIRVAGNNICKGCTIDVLSSDPRWKSKVYHAINTDDNNHEYSLWEDRFPIKELQAERKAALLSGPREYYDWLSERQNIIPEHEFESLSGYTISPVSITIDKNLNKVITINNFDFVFTNQFIYNIGIGIDPAFSDSNSSDFRALPIIAKFNCPVSNFKPTKHLKDGYVEFIVLLDFIYNHEKMNKIICTIFELHRRYIFDVIAVETNTGQILVSYMLKDKSYQDSFFSSFPPKIQNIVNTKHKKDRILRLQPKFNKLIINQNIKNIDYFLREVNNFNSYDDSSIHLLDAMEMIDRVLKPPMYKTVKSYIGIDNNYYDRRIDVDELVKDDFMAI